MTVRHSTFMRLRGILVKESLQIVRDPSSIALAIVMPIVLLFIFGYGVSLDAEYIPTAVVDDDNSSLSREVVARFALSPNFTALSAATIDQASELVRNRQAQAIVRLPADFSKQLLAGQEVSVQLLVNGVDANRARLIQGYARSVLAGWSAMRAARGEAAFLPAVQVAQRIWFNESAESRHVLIPGLITLIMTLIGILLTALVVAREWERGTMEAILVTPLKRGEILLGKILPYYGLGMLGMGLSVTAGIVIFEVPFRGSFSALLLLSSLFLLASLGLGLLLSAAIRVQFVAAQVSLIAGFLPAFFLSGLLFDLESAPQPIQVISHIVPARYFVDISHTLFLAGDNWDVLLPDGLVLAAMALCFLFLAYRNIDKRLEK